MKCTPAMIAAMVVACRDVCMSTMRSARKDIQWSTNSARGCACRQHCCSVQYILRGGADGGSRNVL